MGNNVIDSLLTTKKSFYMKRNSLYLSIAAIIAAFLLLGFTYSSFKLSLCEAVGNQDTQKVKELLDAGETVDCKCAMFPLIVKAIYESNCDIIKLIAAKGGKIDASYGGKKTGLYMLIDERKLCEPEAYYKNNVEYNKRIIKNCKGDTALARKKNWLKNEDINSWSPVIDRVKTVLELGADPNVAILDGVTTPFLKAVELRERDIIDAMISSGKVNFEIRYNAWLENVVSRTYSLTRYQYDKKDWKTIKNWEEIPGNDTPLMSVVSAKDFELVKKIVEAGAFVNAVKKIRTTEKQYDIFNTPQTKTLSYYLVSVLDIAKASGNKEIQNYLISKGAVSMVEK